MALNVLDSKDLSAIKIHLLLKEEKEFSAYQSAYALLKVHTLWPTKGTEKNNGFVIMQMATQIFS